MKEPRQITQIIAADWRSQYHFFAVDKVGQVWGYLSTGWRLLNKIEDE